MSEEDLERMEQALEEAGWIRLECSYWQDPATGIKYTTSAV